jgi:hypothetical protein
VTLMLILGGIAALYMICFLFRLSVFALPVYSGIAAAMLMMEHGSSYPALLAGGFIAGLLVLIVGRLLMACIASPVLRMTVASLFIIPAGFAGYQMVQGLVGLAIADGVMLTILSGIGALVTVLSALRGLSLPLPDEAKDRPAPVS